MNVTIVEGDLFDQDVGVLVNAWNRKLIPWWLFCLKAFLVPSRNMVARLHERCI